MFLCSRGMWNLASRPGIKPVLLALEGEVLTTGPPGKSLRPSFFKKIFIFGCAGSSLLRVGFL